MVKLKETEPKKETLEVLDKEGKVIETYAEISDVEFFENMGLVWDTIQEQGSELKILELDIYGSEDSDLLEFTDEDLISGNQIYKDMRSTLILTKRVTEAFMKAKKPIKKFGVYLEKSVDYFRNIHNYADCMNASVEENMRYFISDKNNLRAIASENVWMAQKVMNAEETPDLLNSEFRETKETHAMYI